MRRRLDRRGGRGDHRVEPLGPRTWDAYARMMERHNGVFGGCWCTYFQTMPGEKTYDADDNRSLKQRLVEEGRAHAALVIDGDEAVAWAQYGTPEELPNIYHRKEYDEAGDPAPDYRVTCIFVDKKHRRHGVTEVALRGALDLIGQAGGGVVEGYPHDTATGARCRCSMTAPAGCSRRPGSPTCDPRACATA